MHQITVLIEACEETLDDDSESIVTYERYQTIGRIVVDAIKKKASPE